MSDPLAIHLDEMWRAEQPDTCPEHGGKLTELVGRDMDGVVVVHEQRRCLFCMADAGFLVSRPPR